MDAVILAAGKGTRLLPITNDIPKPLIQVGGVEILERNILSLPENVENIFIVCNYLGSKIRKFINKKSYRHKAKMIDQDMDYPGTMGALFAAKDYLADAFLVLSGDNIYLQNDIAQLICKPNSILFTTVQKENDVLLSQKKSSVLEQYFVKDKNSDLLINTGAYYIHPDIFDFPMCKNGKGEFSIPHTILNCIENNVEYHAVLTNYWIPVGTHLELELANRYY